MTIPLVILAVLAVIAGFIYTPFNGQFATWLTGESAEDHTNIIVILLSTAAGVIGILLGYLQYGPGKRGRTAPEGKVNPVFRLLERKYYVDELYELVFVRSLQGISKALNAFDRYVVDGLVRGVTAAAVGFGKASTRLQSGQLQTYGIVSLFGFAAIVVFVLLLGRRLW